MMINFDANLLFIWTLARVHSICVPSSRADAGTSHDISSGRISIDPALLVNTCELAAKREYTWFG